ncbi:MAG: ABC transporter ATP-binding protein [Clostridia bacterium]|nr:ABC transporter ATP-binding protein [Clostridia bacterium]
MEELLKVEQLVKAYGEKRVLDHMDFSLFKGEILGFLGPNGAGKSTTVKCMTDIEQFDEGAVYYHSKRLTDAKSFLAFKKELGVVPQEIAIYMDLSAYENVSFFCSLYGYCGKNLKERVKNALTYTGLWEHRKELPSKFSGGMQRRLNIACAIAHSPRILIMDEPTVGIDPQSRNHILNTIRQLNEEGTTVIYISHYMEEIDAICDRVIIADHGVLIEEGGTKELKRKYADQGYEKLEDIFLHLTGEALRDEEGAS